MRAPTKVASGDYIIRADQPYRELADMYLSVQNYPVANPRPYDDTGWTMQYMRDLKLETVTDKSILTASMSLLTGDALPAGSIEGSGDVLVLNHTAENNLMAFRFKNKDVKMSAADEAISNSAAVNSAAGSFIIAGADRGKLEPSSQGVGSYSLCHSVPLPP